LSTRKLAVKQLSIEVDSVSEDVKEEEMAEFVRKEVSKEELIRPMIANAMDSIGKGFSANEIIWERGAKFVPKGYKHRDPRFFQFDRLTGNILSLRDDSNPVEGIPLEAYKYIVHTPRTKTGVQIRSGMARLACVAYMLKAYSIKDWAAFAEVFGMPLRVGKYGTAATAEDKLALLNAVANIGTDAAAIIPESMMIDFVDGARAGGGIGEAVFERLANWLDRQVSKGVLGQTMTTDDGSSQSQATVHNDVRIDIKKDDAMQLTATLQRDLVIPLIDLNFGPQDEYPKIKIFVDEPEDLETFEKAVTPFIDRGLPVEVSVILDKFGLPQPDEGAELLKPKGGSTAAVETPEDPEDEESEEEEASQARQLHLGLMQKVLAGESLTDDQRNLLSVFQEQRTDTIDKLVAGDMEGWRQVMNPMLDPILALASSVGSYEEFVEGLSTLSKKMDADPLTKDLATSMLKARGLGDRLDKI
jgi:phage gp29-like protein